MGAAESRWRTIAHWIIAVAVIGLLLKFLNI
jgi:hypothetical protein